jgi:hypothetical protein
MVKNKKTRRMLEVEQQIGEPIEDFLRREYVENFEFPYKIGKKINISESGIFNWLKRSGIELRSPSESRLPREYIEPTRDQLIKWYYDEEKSFEKIAKDLGVSQHKVKRLFDKNNIKRILPGERRTKYPNFETWEQKGFEKRYDERNPSSLSESKDIEERGWYHRGSKKGWIKKFPFTRIEKFSIEEEWRQRGFEMEYDKRNPRSLQSSKNKAERSWYAKGNIKGWANNFPFRKLRKDGETFEEWKEYGVDNNYQRRSPSDLKRSVDPEERKWYNRGSHKGWTKDFPFKRGILSNQQNTQHLEHLLESYINDNK